jgi:signal transduction histidine kinase
VKAEKWSLQRQFLKKIRDTIQLRFAMKVSERELHFQRKGIETILPVLILIFLMSGWVIMPIRFGFSSKIFFQPHFLAVNAVTLICLVTFIVSKLGYGRLSHYILPGIFLVASIVMLRIPEVMATTPYVPYYAGIVSLVIAGTFLSPNQMVFYFAIFALALAPSMFTSDQPYLEQLHRSLIFFVIAPFVWVMSSFRQKNYQDLEAQNKSLLETANLQSLAQLSGAVAHEINNPLAIISGHAHKMLLKHKKNQLSAEDINEGLDRINTTVFRISKIINGLRKISRKDSSFIFETTAVSTLIEDATALHEESLRNRKIKLKHVASKNELFLECFPVQITQVLINLVGNAIDALDDYENINNRRIEIAVREKKGNILISITNSGPKIRDEIQDKIFTPFFTTKELGKGTGLGLSLCRQIVTAHKGEITLNAKSRLTRFEIRLPKTQSLVQSQNISNSQTRIKDLSLAKSPSQRKIGA